MITLEEFQKLELKVAKIITAERVINSEKLIKLTVDLGKEKRQIIAGIGRYYQPEELLGKEIIVVANLEPKKLMGLESQGMLLAATGEGILALLQPDKEVPLGTKIS